MNFPEEYISLGQIGNGSYANVYKVRHRDYHYIRALRVLHKEVRKENKDVYESFFNECALLQRLGNGANPYIVHIYRPCLYENSAFVEMDYILGENLYDFTEREGFVGIDDVMTFVKEISDALSYCHHDIYLYCMDGDEDDLKDDPEDGSHVIISEEKKNSLINKYKVIHNDMHPGNIMRRKNGDYVLLDFGLSIEGDKVQRTSQVKNGAPEYKAPEKWNGREITEGSDIYGFGAILFLMLTGRPPFPADKNLYGNFDKEKELYEAHKKKTPPDVLPLRKAAFERKYPGKVYKKDYPDWLEKMVMKCLAKNPDDRYRDGKQLHDEFMALYAWNRNNWDDTNVSVPDQKSKNGKSSRENNEQSRMIDELKCENMELKCKYRDKSRMNDELKNKNVELSKVNNDKRRMIDELRAIISVQTKEVQRLNVALQNSHEEAECLINEIRKYKHNKI